MPIPSDPRGRELYLMVSRDAYDRWLSREIESLLRNGFNDVVTTLVTRYTDLSVAQRTRQQQLFASIDNMLSSAYGEANKFASKQLTEYATVESNVERAQLRAVVASGDVNLTFDALSKAEVRNIAALPIAGLDIGSWFEKQATDMSTETRRQIQMGLLQGETPQQIVRRIMPADTSSPATLRAARRNASTLVRTSVTAVHNNTALETMIAAGPTVTDSYRYISVRDARTSKICMALSNKVFAFKDEKKRLPPQHPNCRSTIVAIINYDKLGIPKPPENSPLTFQSYDDWLKGQSSEMQSVILGPSRATLYQDGRMTLGELISTDNRVLNLDQLRARYAGANVPASVVVTPQPTPTLESLIKNFSGSPANPAGIDTLARFTMENGELTAERQALHNAIVDKYLADHVAKENPLVAVMGGGPASGKSVLRSKLTPIPDAVDVDVDDIRELLPEYKKMIAAKDKEASTFTHEEASALSKRIIQTAAEAKYNIVVDGTGDNGIDSLSRKVAGYRTKGARVVARYVTTDADIAFERMIARAAQTGREVPEDYLRFVHADVSRTFPAAIERGLFDEFVLYDNNGATPIRVAEGNGTNITILDEAAWQRFLLKVHV